jgi:biotin synthesis protein BioG
MLLLFFNGWGMDESLVKHLIIPKNSCLKIVNYPYKIQISKEENIIPIGYSFGVYYLTKWITQAKLSFSKVIAINGTPEIIGLNGIFEKVFQTTYCDLSEATLKNFFKNMGVDQTFKRPNKSIDELKAELKNLYDNYQPQANVFTHALISENDRIISAKRQEKYFQAQNTKIKKISGGHFAFATLKNWRDIIDEF